MSKKKENEEDKSRAERFTWNPEDIEILETGEPEEKENQNEEEETENERRPKKE